MNTRVIGPLLAVMVLIAACRPAEPADVVTVVTETPTAAPAASDRPTPASTPSASPSQGRVLEDRYYADSDGNAVPDFIETELGYDPATDDCLVGECPEAEPFLAPDGAPRVEENTLLILDASGSMAADDGSGTVKIDTARDSLERLVVGTPDTTNLGLLVYGHRGDNNDAGKAESCAGIELFSPLGELTPESVPGVLDQFRPTGWTPIGASLDRAGEVFAGTEGARNRVILVTDGIETCDGDPVGAARRLAESGVEITVDVVGFDVETQADRQALEAIAEASGGTYTNAEDADQLNNYVDELVADRANANRAWICLRDAVLRAGACDTRLYEYAEREILAEREAEEINSPRREALQELLDTIGDASAERNRLLTQEYSATLDELEAAYRAADERYQERYGRPVSLSQPLCPYQDLVPAIA